MIRSLSPWCLLALAWSTIAAAEPGPLERILTGLQDDLTRRLTTQAQGTVPQEFRLVFRRAVPFRDSVVNVGMPFVRREDLVVRLFRYGDRWLAPSASTNSTKANWQSHLDRFDTTGLTWDGKTLGGRLGLHLAWQSEGQEMGPGENSHSMMKAARKSTPDWNVGGRERVAPYALTVELEASQVPEGLGFEFTLEEVAGDASPAQPLSASDTTPIAPAEKSQVHALLGQTRNPVTVKMTRTAGVWTIHDATGWNRAVHQVDVSGLHVGDGRLRGELKLTIMNDGWLPPDGKSPRIRCAIDAPLSCGTFDSVYRASGDQGEFSGRIHGSVWQPLQGRFTIASQPDGIWKDRIAGGLREAPAAPAGIRGLTSAIATGDALATAIATYRRINTYLIEAVRSPCSVDELPIDRLEIPAMQVSDATAQARLIAAMAYYAERTATAIRAGHRPVVGRSASPDLEFGPYFGHTPLGAGNRLPATTGSAGAQEWSSLAGWRCLGPFVHRGRLKTRQSLLPEILPVAETAFINPRLRLGRWEGIPLAWLPSDGEALQVRPVRSQWDPVWVAPGKLGSYVPHPKETIYRAAEAGNRSYVWFASTVVASDRDQRVWLALRVNPFGQLWVNGVLVWDSGDRHDPWLPAILPIDLVRGDNQILVHSGEPAIGYAPPPAETASSFSLLIATRGVPQAGARPPSRTVEAAASGRFQAEARNHPDAEPPLAWDLKNGVNVLWRSPCRASGAPLIRTGDRLFATSEPHRLSCLDAGSGKVLWERSCNVLEAAADPTVRRLAPVFEAQVSSTPLAEDANRSKELPPGAIVATDPADEDAAVPAKAASADKEPPNARPPSQPASGGNDKTAKANLPADLAALAKHLVQAGILERAPAAGSSLVLGARAGAAPVVVGERVYVRFGTGAAACFDLDGNRKWMVDTGLPWVGGDELSPVLIGGRLVLATPTSVLALDGETGKTLWRNDLDQAGKAKIALPPLGVNATRLAGPGGDRDVVIVSDGRILDARDGRQLAQGLFALLPGGSTPLVDGSEVYWTSGTGQMRLHLWIDAADRLGCAPVWQFRRTGNGGNHGLLHEGILYVPRVADDFHPHNAFGWTQLDVYDATAGHHYAKAKPALDDSLHPLPTVAARTCLVFADSGDASIGIMEDNRRPQIGFIAKGDKPRIINRMDFPRHSRIHCEPLLAGRRMYVRLDHEIICLGAETPEGRRYEEEQRAALVFAAIGEHPRMLPVIEPAPLAAGVSGLPVCDLLPDLPPDRWLAAGPFPRLAQPGLPGELADPIGTTPLPGSQVAWGGVNRPLVALADAFLTRKGRSLIISGDTTHFRPGQVIDLLPVVDRKPQTTFFFASSCRTEDPRTLRFAMRCLGVTCWLSGRPLKDGEIVRFKPGTYPLVLRFDLASLPPFGRPLLEAMFTEVQDPHEAEAEWIGRIRRHREELERIITVLPSRAERAKSILEALSSP